MDFSTYQDCCFPKVWTLPSLWNCSIATTLRKLPAHQWSSALGLSATERHAYCNCASPTFENNTIFRAASFAGRPWPNEARIQSMLSNSSTHLAERYCSAELAAQKIKNTKFPWQTMSVTLPYFCFPAWPWHMPTFFGWFPLKTSFLFPLRDNFIAGFISLQAFWLSFSVFFRAPWSN